MRKLLLTLLITATGVAAMAQDISGTWQGTADVGGQKLKAVFHITKENGQFKVSFDSPDQGGFGIKCDGLTMLADSVHIKMSVIGGGYNGKWNGGNEIAGAISQSGRDFILPLQRVAEEKNAASKPKPQTPQPPFGYTSEEVSYENTLQNVHLAGTLTKPSKGTKFPVVLLITGSGAQDRDESIGMHKPFALIADYLTKQGIAVLRVDDRGVGGSTGNFRASSSADFATDVIAGINYLKTRNDIDAAKIGLLGHSEGGLIAPYVAARNKNVAFIVTLAGPVTGGQKLNDFQNTLPMTRAGMSKETIDAFLLLHHTLTNAAVSIADEADYKNAVQRIFIDWKQKQSPEIVKRLINGADADVIPKLQSDYATFRNAWWKFVFSYDPVPDLEKLTIPVLALNGEKDEQVEAKTNLAAFNEALKKSKSKNYRTIEVAGVNHLFQHCKECGSIKEYLALEETFDAPTLAIISDWIKTVTQP
jgi:pimeloyl-ACP methyl ester carboxylesterase